MLNIILQRQPYTESYQFEEHQGTIKTIHYLIQTYNLLKLTHVTHPGELGKFVNYGEF